MQLRAIAITALLVLSGSLLVSCNRSLDHQGGYPAQGSGPFLIAQDPAITGYTQLAMNSKGEALVSWRQLNGSVEIVHAVTSTAAGSWGDEQALSGRSSMVQRTAMSESGDAFVVWEDYVPGGSFGIGSNHSSPGGSWDGMVLVETHTTGDAIEPWVATSPTGTTVAVWRQYGGGTFEVWANQRGPVEGWGSPELLARVTGGSIYAPTVAVDAGGNAVAAWVEFLNGYTIRAKRYQAGSGWDALSALIGAPASPFDPKIGMDKNGNATVIWNYAENAHHGIQSNRYVAGSGWSGVETIIDQDDSVAFIFGPEIAVASDGTAVLVWEQSNGPKYDIWADHYELGTGWTKAPIMLNDGTEDSQSPHAAIDAKGHAVVAWRQIPSWNQSVWAASYQADTGWGVAQRLSAADDKGFPMYINAAMDANGNALIVWDANYSNPHSTTIWGSRITQP